MVVVVSELDATTDGLGITPGNPLSLIQASETGDEAQLLSSWFEAHWASLPAQDGEKQRLVDALRALAAHGAPLSAYALILHHLFGNRAGFLLSLGDRLKRVCIGRDLPDAAACARFDKATKQGEDMKHAQLCITTKAGTDSEQSGQGPE